MKVMADSMFKLAEYYEDAARDIADQLKSGSIRSWMASSEQQCATPL